MYSEGSRYAFRSGSEDVMTSIGMYADPSGHPI